VLALKGNQGKLSQQVENWFKQAEEELARIEYSYHETDGIETRQVWRCQSGNCHRYIVRVRLTSVILVKSIRQLWNKTTTVRFYQ